MQKDLQPREARTGLRSRHKRDACAFQESINRVLFSRHALPVATHWRNFTSIFLVDSQLLLQLSLGDTVCYRQSYIFVRAIMPIFNAQPGLIIQGSDLSV